ncbi:Peptidoglycan/LPS O-acetylase OafA/YrhL, contains acyltransferase and SGNH-hydrolase domains [Pseudobutyrivibrio sp. 49]|nr:Peptidoglycan/LPS O-acetylase OafA/YrhL, contains acyltransferase and SGNH-hydrolase domains [Pseudobutyrivibrio sp. 49]
MTYKSYENNYNFRHNIMDWYKKKFIRIIPLFYIAVIVYTLSIGGCGWLGSEPGITWKNLACHFLLVHGLVPHYADSVIGVEWYVGVLSIFYIIVPILYKYINSLERAIAFFILTAMVNPIIMRVIINYVYEKQISDVYIYEAYFGSFCFMNQIPVLGLGIILFYLRKINCRGQADKTDKKLISYITLFGAILPIKGMARNVNNIEGLSHITLFGIIFLVIILGQIAHENKLICNSVFCMLGKYSYAIYLVHYGLLYLYNYSEIHFTNPWMNCGVRYLIITIVSFIIAVPITNYIEKPAVKMLDKILIKSEG